jgi:hypothetical protein
MSKKNPFAKISAGEASKANPFGKKDDKDKSSTNAFATKTSSNMFGKKDDKASDKKPTSGFPKAAKPATDAFTKSKQEGEEKKKDSSSVFGGGAKKEEKAESKSSSNVFGKKPDGNANPFGAKEGDKAKDDKENKENAFG